MRRHKSKFTLRKYMIWACQFHMTGYYRYLRTLATVSATSLKKINWCVLRRSEVVYLPQVPLTIPQSQFNNSYGITTSDWNIAIPAYKCWFCWTWARYDCYLGSLSVNQRCWPPQFSSSRYGSIMCMTCVRTALQTVNRTWKYLGQQNTTHWYQYSDLHICLVATVATVWW